MFVRPIRRFHSDQRGNIAPLFALSLIPLMGMIGLAVDYSRASAVRATLQSVLDSTALAMASKAATLSQSDLELQATTYFNSLYNRNDTSGVTIKANYNNVNGPALVLTAETMVKTTLMSLHGIGIDSIKVGVDTTANWGNTRLRVALALDNTGSMAQNNKMTALKNASKALIDQLKAAATVNGDVYISIVPFAKDVNVGIGNVGASWIKWSDDTPSTNRYVWDTNYGSSHHTCTVPGYTTKNSCQSHGGIWNPDENPNHASWTGCVTDRDQPNDTKNTAPGVGDKTTLFPAEVYAECPAQLMPLSYDWATLKNKIDSMQPNGNTNTTIGLEWGWHSLTQGSPLNAPAEPAPYIYNKVIIFLTDGDNTQNRFTSTQSQIDARMAAACTNAKAAGIQIYTILLMQGNETLLKNCATDPSYYFKITDPNQTLTVFNQIGTKLAKLHVAK
jgi:Flp pilus assembly protein TadG